MKKYLRYPKILFTHLKGAFNAHGVFYPLPWIDTQKMALVFKDKVFSMLIREGKISEDLAGRIYNWPHSGFNIHNEVEISADDDKGKKNLAQYIIKALISQERMIYDRKNQKVIYKSKHGTIAYEPLDWLAAITSHIYSINALKASIFMVGIVIKTEG